MSLVPGMMPVMSNVFNENILLQINIVLVNMLKIHFLALSQTVAAVNIS